MSKILLETARLRLREMEWEDYEFVAGMLADPEVMRFYPRVYSADEAKEWLERQLLRYQQDCHGLWLVEERMTGQPLGQVGLLQQEVEGEWLLEIGYLIARPFWRQGFASEAAIGCQQYAFEQLDAERVHSLIRPVNIPSQRTALKGGLKPIRLVMFKDYEHLLFAKDRPAPAV